MARAARASTDATKPASGVWTRALGVTLVHTSAAAVAGDASLLRALTDGIERAWEVQMPEGVPDAAEWFEVREAGEAIGVAIAQRQCPKPDEVSLLAVAIIREARGRAGATKTLLAAERRLLADGAKRMLARVPRTNGRGLYFMLRAGFTPVPPEERPDDSGDATWFSRKDAGSGS